MKKFFAILVLLVLIITSFGFVVLKTLAQGAETNIFNRKFRSSFARSPIFRDLLGLHFDGDAKSDYLGQKYTKIRVEVDAMQGVAIDIEALSILTEKMKSATGKEVDYVISDEQIPYAESVDAQQIGQIAAKYRSFKSHGDTASLYLLYLSSDDKEAQLLGKTYQEDGVVLYLGGLKQFISANPETLKYYEESTALHEFGHQLGLGHDEQEGCLMTARAETTHVARQDPMEVITDFCDYEKRQIDIIKNSFN